jgi:hypothetical protein
MTFEMVSGEILGKGWGTGENRRGKKRKEKRRGSSHGQGERKERGGRKERKEWKERKERKRGKMLTLAQSDCLWSRTYDHSYI